MRDHVIYFLKVLNRLREHELFVNGEKYEFAKFEIMFLDHWIREGHVKIDPWKIQTKYSSHHWMISTEDSPRVKNLFRVYKSL